MTNPARPAAAVERLQDCLAAVRQWDARVKAMITVDEAGATRAAEAADRAAADGRSLGLLHGVPIAVKDNIDTAGLRTTYGSLFYEHHVPATDAPVVERLRRAGAVIVGKATLHEFAFGTRSVNPVIGQCRNPWDERRIPGGSSGGSAVAVATGMAEMALGTDTGASVRLPASFTGITGLRPTTGRVSNRGSFPLSPTHDIIGPMARSVDEVALLFAVIAGHDGQDPHSEPQTLPNFLPRLRDGIAGLRIGRPRHHYFEGIDGPVSAAVDDALRTLERLGARIVDIDVPGAETIPEWFPVILISDARDVHAERLGPGSERWDPQTLDRLGRGASYSGADYAHALRLREQWRLSLEQVFRQVDVIASPTCPTVAPPVVESRSLFDAARALTKNLVVGPFGGIPGLSVPCGFSPEGLPIGLQLEAARWNEPLLLQAGAAYQAVTDWHRRRPTVNA
ncbi:MAG: amidase [Burkholderiales bacterium]